MNEFIGRVKELRELKDAIYGTRARLIVIKGRRRVGKSRLAEEFASQLKGRQCFKLMGQPPVKGLSRQDELHNIAVQIAQTFTIPTPAVESWDDALWQIADRVRGGNCTLIIDEINWFGKTDKAIAEKLFIAWEQYFKHYKNFTLILSGSLAGWIENKFSNNTAYVGRIALNLTLKELPLPDALRFFDQRRKTLSAHEQLKLLLTVGGIPSYLQEINPRETAENNIRRLFFKESGFLFNEFDVLLNDLFQRKNARFKSILQTLTKQKRSAKDIDDTLKIPGNQDIYQDLATMEKSGFIERIAPWNLKTAKSLERYQYYRISDNYLRFYLSSVYPEKERIQSGNSKLPPNLNAYLGIQFENLLLKNRHLIVRQLGLTDEDILKDGTYIQTPTKARVGCQIDYLLQTRYSLYLVEIKYYSEPVGLPVINDVQRKIAALQCPRHLSIRPVLVHVNGVKATVVEADFFDRIIDIGEVMGQ